MVNTILDIFVFLRGSGSPTWKVVIVAANMESFWPKSFHHTTLQSMLVIEIFMAIQPTPPYVPIGFP